MTMGSFNASGVACNVSTVAETKSIMLEIKEIR